MVEVDNAGGTPGSRLHGNPMYAGRDRALFRVEFVALAIGMAKARSRS